MLKTKKMTKAEKVAYLFVINGSVKAFRNSVHNVKAALLKGFRPIFEKFDLGAKTMEAELNKYFGVLLDNEEALIVKMSAIVEREFSEADVDALIAFFSSPVAKKWIVKQKTMAKEIQLFGDGINKEAIQLLERKIRLLS